MREHYFLLLSLGQFLFRSLPVCLIRRAQGHWEEETVLELALNCFFRVEARLSSY